MKWWNRWLTDNKTAKRSAPLIEELEPRVLLSADAAGIFAPDPGSLQQQTPTELLLDDILEPAPSQQVAQEETRTLELVFVDTDSPDYQSIVASLTDNEDESRQFEVIVLDNHRDGVWQITQTLQNYSGVDAIHLVSHGDSNGVDLGNTRLDADSLAVQQDQFLAWANHLAGNADILIYGCNLASSEAGLSLMQELASVTGADIAASEDLTGHNSLGGDWVLEAHVGQVETGIFASRGLVDSFRATLAAPVGNDDSGGGYAELLNTYNPDGYYRIDDPTSITDEVSANTGSSSGGPTASTNDPIRNDSNDSLNFDGADDYVTIPHSAAYEIDEGTISLWFNSTNIGNGDALFSKDASGTAEGGHLTISFNGSGQAEVRLQRSGAPTSFTISSSGLTLDDGNWHNVVFTFGSGGMALYVDGVLQSSDAYTGGMRGDTGDTPNQEPIALGASRIHSASGNTAPGGGYFDGLLDEFAIFDTALSAEQIADLYRAADAPYEIGEDGGSLTVGAAGGVLANDTDADGDPLTASLVSSPNHASAFVLNADGSFTYTPSANFSGTDSFVYRVDDGNGGSDTATATIRVEAAADDPAFFDYSHTVSLSSATPSDYYPVAITLTEGVNGFAHANALANGDDLRFYDSAGTELSYWIEEWNNSGSSTVWVDVAQTGTSSIEMLYGNATASAQSDGEATFDFFDNFEDGSAGNLPAGWSLAPEAQDGTQPEVRNDGGNLVFYDGSTGGTGDVVFHGGEWTDLVVRQDFKVTSSGDPITDATMVARYQDPDNAIAAGIHSDNTAKFWYTTTADGWVEISSVDLTSTALGAGVDLADGNWHTQELRITGNTVELYIDDVLVGTEDYSSFGIPASGSAGFWSQDNNDEAYRDNHFAYALDAGTGVITGSAGAVSVGTSMSIDENSANGAVVGSVNAADPDADTLSYSITAGNTGAWTGDAFAIDNSGLITVNNSDALNFEDTPTFNLTVEINDGTGRTDTQAVTVNLNDINDPVTGTIWHTLLDDDGDGIPEDGERLWSLPLDPVEDEDGIIYPINITWFRDGVQIPGALGIFYTLTQDDVGADITSVWSFNDMGGTSEAVTSSPISISNNNDTPTGSVTLSGIAQSGETLSAANTLADIDGMTTSTVTYHWQRDTGSGFVDTGDTGSTYTLTGLDVGADVRVEARYTDDQGTDEAVASNSTGSVAPGFGADIISIETADLDEDGFIDALHVTFDDFIQDSTVRADDFDVAGVGGEAFVSTTNGDVADDDDIYITFTDGVLATGATPQVTYLGDSPTDPDILDDENNVAGDFVAWWDSNWQNRLRVDINNAASSTPVSDFPLLIELSGSDIDFSLISANGADIRFVDNNGTPLSYDIESWDDGTETARIWVKVPQLDAGADDESIYLYFNNGAASDNQDPAGVWSEGLGVYHFNEDPGPGGVGDILESSGSANNGTAEASMTSGDLVGGQIGTGIDFDGVDDSINFGAVDVGDTFTLSAWIRPDSAGSGIQTIVANSAQGAATAGFRFFINTSGTQDGSIIFETGNGTNGAAASTLPGTINFDEWNHVAVEVNRTTGAATIYHNGMDVTNSATTRTDFTTNSDFRVGQMEGGTLEFDGVIDELRVESEGRSADFIQARYLSQISGGTFTRFGATESQTRDAASPLVTITRDDADNTNAASVTFSVDFSEDVSNVDASDFDVALTGTASANATVSVTDAGDADDSTYAVTVSGISGEGTVGLDIDAGNVDIVDAVGNALNNTPTTDQVYSVDRVEPVINSVVLADTSLTVGESTTVTITFSEAVTNFDNGDITLANGTLTPVSSADGGITWTGTFTPTDDIEDATNVITVGTTLTDLAGNAPLASRDSANYAIDTREPVISSVVLADTSLTVGESTTVTITFSEAVTNFDNGDITLANGTLTPVSSADGGITWTGTFTPTDDIEDATNVITVGTTLTDLAGNAPLASRDSANYAIDTREPVINSVVLADTSLTVGESTTVTITFSEAVTNFDNGDITLANGTLTPVSSADGGITWTGTFTPTDDIEDATNVITVGTTLTDLAGNAPLASRDSANYAIDTREPVINSVVLADTSLTVGESTTVTITFSEAATNFDNGDITLANGTLTPVSSADGGITWTGTFTPTDDIEDATNVITVGTTLTDLAGNAPLASRDSANYAIDTREPVINSVVLADTSLTVGESTTVTITFSEAVTNFDNGDITLANGTLTPVSSADGGITWTGTFTPTDDIEDATNVITVGTTLTDLAGNAPLASRDSANYAIDTREPVINSVVLADTSLTAGESTTATITFSEAVTNFDNGDITLANGTLTPVSSADGGITWTGTFTPTDDIEDATNVITVGTTLTDLAGNAPLASRDSANYAIDTREPVINSVVLADTSLTAGESTTVTITFSEAVTNFDNGDITLANGTLTPVSSADGGITWTGTFTPTDDIEDATNVISVGTTLTDLAGNAPLASRDSANYAIDTREPLAPVITGISDDTGAADRVTSDRELLFNGTAEPGSTVEVFLNAASLGTAIANGSGVWSFDHQAVSLPDGVYTLTSQATDIAGNTGPLSASFAFTVDATGPDATINSMSDDTGAADNVTSDAELVFSGTAEAGNVVEVFLNAASLGTVNADGAGNWLFDYSGTTLPDGDYSLTAQARDTATNQTGAVSTAFAFTVDTAPPAAFVTGITPDTGFADNRTSATNLSFVGTADPGNRVEVFLDAASLGTVMADGAGNWTLDYTATSLADGDYTLTAQAEDLATGDTGPLGGALNFTVDTTPPPNRPPVGDVTISNTAPSEGDVLTASNDLFDGDGIGLGTITYHWQRDTGSGFVDIGETGTHYTATQADVGATLRVEARYTDLRGFDEAVASSGTAAVLNIDNASTGEVSIDNLSPVQGDTLTASNTLDDPDGLSGTIAYQWQRDGVDIAGQNGTIYVTSQADVGNVISVVASYVDDLGGTGSVASVATSPVADVNDAPTGEVSISGNAVEDDVLTASNTLADEDGLGTVSYQWQRDGVDVAGANADSYTLGQEDVGSVITVVASYTDGGTHPESVSSTASALVANINDAPTGTILSTTGTMAPGDTLIASNGLFDEDGISGDLSFQWMRNGTAIAGATGASYTLSGEDVDETITVIASYTDDFGTRETVESRAVVARVGGTPPGGGGAGTDVRDERGQVNIPDDRASDDVSTGPIDSPALDDPLVPPPSNNLNDPVLDSDIGTDPVLEIGDTFNVGNQTGTGNSLLNFGNQTGGDADGVDENSDAKAAILEAERDRELVDDLLQLIQGGETEEDITLTAGAAGTAVIAEEIAEEEELAVIDDILTNHALWDAIDQMNEEMASQSINKLTREELVVQFVSTSGLGLFAAITVYALRGGALMASWLSTVPLWGTLDPLPVLRDKKEEKDDKDSKKRSSSERKAESLFSGQEGA